MALPQEAKPLVAVPPRSQSSPQPDPWADPNSRSTLGVYNLHHRSTRVQNSGIYLLDPPRGLTRAKAANGKALLVQAFSYG